MDFFRSGSSPLPKQRSDDASSDDDVPDPGGDTNLFSYYFMVRTGKYLDLNIAEQTKKFIFRTRSSKEPLAVKTKEVQQFYRYMSERIRNFHFFEGYEQEKLDTIVVGMERFIMVNICANVFNSKEDKQKNMVLDEKIKALHWILPKHLDFTLPSDNENTDRQLALAQYYLLEMSKKRSPHDKISCMVLCCKALHNLHMAAHDNVAGADEFLPLLIYIIIVAAPVNLYATTQYIDRFLPQERLMSGETAYNFTNICCAIQFLENITPEKLSLSSEEFERYMDGHSSHLEEALSNKFASGLLENISRVKECEEKIRQLQSYHMKLKENTEKLQFDVQNHKNDVLQSVQAMTSKYKTLEDEMEKVLND